MWRRILSAVLIVFSCALIPVSVLALWVRNEILNTDDYVRTVSPLAENQDIINAVSVRVTNTLFENVDVEELAKENLPPKISFLAGPLAGGLKTFTQDATLRFFQSEQFRQLWNVANRRAHAQVKNALTGGGTVISTRNGRVTIDLSEIAVKVRSDLSKRGIGIFDKLPIGTLALRYELFDSASLGHAQSAVRLLNTLRWVLPVLVLGFGAAGIFLAGNRRRGLLRWGLGIVVATLFLGFALALGRGLYLERIAGGRVPVRRTRPRTTSSSGCSARRTGCCSWSACSSRSAPTWPARRGSRSRCGAAPPVPSTASATGSRRAASTSTASPSSSPGTRIRSGSRVSSPVS